MVGTLYFLQSLRHILPCILLLGNPNYNAIRVNLSDAVRLAMPSQIYIICTFGYNLQRML